MFRSGTRDSQSADAPWAQAYPQPRVAAPPRRRTLSPGSLRSASRHPDDLLGSPYSPSTRRRAQGRRRSRPDRRFMHQHNHTHSRAPCVLQAPMDWHGAPGSRGVTTRRSGHPDDRVGGRGGASRARRYHPLRPDRRIHVTCCAPAMPTDSNHETASATRWLRLPHAHPTRVSGAQPARPTRRDGHA